MITIHNQGNKQFYNAGGGDVITDIDSNFTEVQNNINAIVVPTKATGADVTTGTDDAKFVTAKALQDAGVPKNLVKANGGEVNAGTDDAKFVTAKAIADSDVSFAVKATGAEINTGTDDAKFATAKAIADSNIAFLSDIPVTTWKVGSTAKDTSITGNQVIAHGLGRVPKILQITMLYANTNAAPVVTFTSTGAYDGTTNTCSFFGTNGANGTSGTTASYLIYFSSGNNVARATATFDATNITLNWTQVNTPTETIFFTWQVN